MKKLFVLTVMVLIVLPVLSQVKFENKSFNQVIAKAKKENKKIYIDCYTSWCIPCKILIDEIFPNKMVGDFMNDKFVSVRVDMEKGEGVVLRKKYNISIYPTILILNSDGTELSRSVGPEYTPTNFIEKIGKLLDSDISEARAKFKKSLDGANQFIKMLNDNYLIGERDRALVSVYNRRTSAENYNLVNFDFYDSIIRSIYHPVVLSILNDGNNAIKFLGRKRYSAFVRGKVDATLVDMSSGGTINSDKITELAVMSKKYKEINTPLLKYFMKVSSHIDDNDLEEVISHSLNMFKSLGVAYRADVALFVQCMAINNGKMERLIPFYEACINKSSLQSEKDRYSNSLSLVIDMLKR